MLHDLYRAYGRFTYGGAFCIYSWIVFPHRIVSKIIPDSGIIYDLGCGSGIFSTYLAIKCKERVVIAIDSSSKRINAARRALRNLNLSNLTFIKGDVLNFDFESCDAVVINNLLHHLSGWSNQKKFLETIVPTVKPGGKVVIVDINKTPLWKYYFTLTIDKIMYPGEHIEFPNKAILETFFTDRGFKFKIYEEDIHYGMPYSYITYIAEKII